MNVKKQDIGLLMCFEAIAASGSVSKAAQQMHVTQPAMSNALGRLRKLFADPLFVKTREGVAPTPKALQLAEPIRKALAGVDEIFAPAGKFDPRTARARLTVTATDYVEFVLMPRLVRHLEKYAPGIDLEIRVTNRDMASQWIERGEIDFRIGWLRQPPGRLHFKTLYRDRLVCLVRRNHPSVRSSLTAEQYCALRHVRTATHRLTELTESGPIIDAAVAQLGRELRIAVRSQDFVTVPFIVARSNLVATIPERLAKPFLNTLPIKMLEPPITLPEIAITLFWHERTQNSPLHKWFRTVASNIAATL